MLTLATSLTLATRRQHRSGAFAVRCFVLLLCLCGFGCEARGARAPTGPAAAERAHAEDPLPSWNEGAAKHALLRFVERTTMDGSPDFVAPEQRISVFDNDGTLWSEQPIYVQFAFALDRVQVLAPQHPEWSGMPPFRAALERDQAALSASGGRGLATLMAATHAGNTTAEFSDIVQSWMASARHPRFDRPYADLVYQPMLELLRYLRRKGFKTFIASGGGVEFMRAWAEPVYGVPPEQVVGSRAKLRYAVRNGAPVLERLPEIDFVDDGAGKPVGIHEQIGRQPVLAFGNSDGDFEMLEWTTSAPGPRLAVLIHHTDGVREWAYDRNAQVGQLARALDEAPRRGWVRVDMKTDWRRIYPFQD